MVRLVGRLKTRESPLKDYRSILDCAPLKVFTRGTTAYYLLTSSKIEIERGPHNSIVGVVMLLGTRRFGNAAEKFLRFTSGCRLKKG